MNCWQLFMLWTGLAAIVVMCLCPPWETAQMTKLGPFWQRQGYRYIWSSSQDYWRPGHGVRTFHPNTPELGEALVRIDASALAIQCAVVALVTGALVATLKGRHKETTQQRA